MDSYSSPLMVAIYAIIAILGCAIFFGVVLPQVPTRSIVKMFLGVQAPPILVAFLRRAATVLISAIVTRVAMALGIGEGLDVAGIAVAAWGLVELGWGMLDQTKKSGQNDVNPEPVAGGGSRDLLRE